MSSSQVPETKSPGRHRYSPRHPRLSPSSANRPGVEAQDRGRVASGAALIRHAGWALGTRGCRHTRLLYKLRARPVRIVTAKHGAVQEAFKQARHVL